MYNILSEYMAILNVKWERCSQTAQLGHLQGNISDISETETASQVKKSGPQFLANQKISYAQLVQLVAGWDAQ